jgi:hypothetical protein
MKTRTLPFLSVAIATCLASVSPAQDVRRVNGTAPAILATAPARDSGAGMDLAQGVYIAAIDVEERSVRKYAGQKLFNTQGAELGTIKDFIVHPATSRVRYAVVSSGGVLGGMGNSLRLVPIESIRWGTRGNMFEIDILQSAWLQVPPVSDQNYVADRFNISAAQHEGMVGSYGTPQRGAATMRPTDNEFAGLIRASAVRGRTVYAANRKVGDIEYIIIDLERGTAGALLDASGDFTGTTAKYLIPLSRLSYNNPRQDPITTTLTRADFDAARPGSFGVAASTAAANEIRVATEPPLTPTGRISTPPLANPTADAIATSVQSIRHAINNDPVLVGEQVQVTTENGRIVLRGAVRNNATRNNLENAARRAAPAVNIDNQIAVMDR